MSMVNASYLKTLAVIADSLNTLNKKIEKEDPQGEVVVSKMLVRNNSDEVVGEFINDSGEWDFVPHQMNGIS